MIDESQLETEPEEAEENTEEEPEPELTYSEDAPNLVREFSTTDEGRKALKKIAAKIIDEYDVEWEAQEGYREQWAEDLELFAMKLREKPAPFQDCANFGIPMMAENVTRLIMKAKSELFGDWSRVMAFSALGPSDQEESDAITLHVNYQLREELKDFHRQMERGLLMYFMGRVACHSYWDETRKCIRHEMLTPEEFVIPWQHVTTMPDLSDCPWIIRRRLYATHELEQLRDSFENVTEVLEKSKRHWDDDALSSKTHDMLDEMNELDKPDGGAETPYLVLQYEGWLTLPKQDRQRYVQVFVEPSNNIILSMRIHEEPTWEERNRYERQRIEIETYRSQKQMRDQQQLMQGAMETAGTMMPQMPMEQEPELIPPDWMQNPDDLGEEPEPMRREPIHMFSYTVCIESLEGAEGIGYGRPQAELNKAANTLVSQYVDSATLANTPCWVASPDVAFSDNDPFTISPGKVNKMADTGPSEVAKALMKVDIPPANPQMVQLVQMLFGWAQSSAQSPDILSGGEVKSGEPYRSTAARMEQASQQLSAITQKFSLFVKQIMRNHVKLNQYFLPDEMYFSIPTYKGGEPIKITRRMYQAQRPILMTADMRYASQAQRVAEADEIVKMAMTVPILQDKPRFMYEAFKKSLIARGRSDMLQFLGPEPPIVAVPQMAPPGIPGGPGPSLPKQATPPIAGARNAAQPELTPTGMVKIGEAGGEKGHSLPELTK